MICIGKTKSTSEKGLFSVFTWRHGGHIGVENNREKSLGTDSIIMHTNMAVSSRESKLWTIHVQKLSKCFSYQFIFLHPMKALFIYPFFFIDSTGKQSFGEK